jgi:redox-sensitive bicupin YhaK (pirin superfamily)
MALTVRRAGERFVTRQNGWEGRYCFSYGEHYDSANTSFGPLLACNEFRLEPGAGFEDHEHRAIEIVTWVVDGAVLHDRGTVVVPGQVQVLSAGTGVMHAELNASATEPARFLQMWLASDDPGGTPAYGFAEIVFGDGLVPVVGAGGPLTARSEASLYAGRLAPGTTVPLPTATRVHVFLVRGRARVLDLVLEDGDELRVVDDEGLQLTAESATEVLVWALP